ncbi:MAG TPA: hypothetical protein VFE24_07320 [Pirellulales bacterium]|jgi:hypothetical protein|nr:hypothetical protein [Pirellulales bacterium]
MSRPAGEDSPRRFALWAIERLGLTVEPRAAGVYELAIPPDQQQTLFGAPQVKFTFDKAIYEQAPLTDPVEFMTPGSRLLGWLVEQVRRLGKVAQAFPATQPNGVQELAGPLLSAYRVEGGSVHLAGCTLEPRPILKLVHRLRLEGLEPHDELTEVFAAGGEAPLAPEVVAALRLDALAPAAPPPKIARPDLERLLDQASQFADERRKAAEAALAEALLPKKLEEIRQLEDYFAKTKAEISTPHVQELAAEEQAAIAEQIGALEQQQQRRLAAIDERYSVSGNLELVAAILIWTRFAAGKLRFTLGAATADTPFAAWAGLLQPPPYVCPYTNRPTFHLAATDDGRIVAAEELGQCELTGRRVLKRELVREASTGKWVRADLTDLCAVSGQRVLKDRFVTCPICHVHVNPQILHGNHCRACPPARAILKDDPRLARLLGEYPGLDGWRSWKLAESPAAYLCTAAGLWRQLFLVFDKRTLEPLRIASKTRFATAWTDLATTAYDEVLR